VKQEHTFKIVDHEGFNRDIYPSVSMEIDSEATISDLLYAFERFLQATGYVLPENSHLELTPEDDNHFSHPHELPSQDGF
jgi:hypothetical protein